MPRRQDWRSAATVETLKRIDRGGFAWEFLRRNPRYRREYDQISKQVPSAASVREAVGQRWGLCFRLRSKAGDLRRSGDLATGACASQRDPGLGTD
jgi:hypothetical protein